MENQSTYKKVLEFKQKYRFSIIWRLKQNTKVIEKHLNKEEKVIYAFAAQKNNNPFDIFATAVVAITNKRILIGRKRVLFGYFLDSVTPDMFNDLKILSGVIWGKIHIDTVKEFITLSNIDKRALPEIESEISSYMMELKKSYSKKEK